MVWLADRESSNTCSRSDMQSKHGQEVQHSPLSFIPKDSYGRVTVSLSYTPSILEHILSSFLSPWCIVQSIHYRYDIQLIAK